MSSSSTDLRTPERPGAVPAAPNLALLTGVTP